MQSTFLVMIGGAAGAGLRYQLSLLFAPGSTERWPWPTLTANLIGALAMGALLGWLQFRDVSDVWRLTLSVGVLGGFTTFSAFSAEMLAMLNNGAWLNAATYAALSVVGTLALCAIGFAASRMALA